MKNLQSREIGRTIRVEMDTEARHLKVLIRYLDDEVFLSFSPQTVQEIPKLVCWARTERWTCVLAWIAAASSGAGSDSFKTHQFISLAVQMRQRL
jgi:hypothetical protein